MNLTPETQTTLIFGAAAVGLFGLGALFAALLIPRKKAVSEAEAEILTGEIDRLTTALNEAEKSAHLGSFTWDFQNPAVSFWSNEAYLIFGLVQRRSVPDIDVFATLAHTDDQQLVKNAWIKARAERGEFSFSFRAALHDGSMRYVRIKGHTVLADAHTPLRIHGAIQDITQEMEIDRAKSEFVSLASHQLKTPLTSLRWLTETMLSGAVGTFAPQQLKYITDMQVSTMRMIALVNDLLNVSRIELGKLATQIEEIDLRVLAEDVIKEQQHASEERHVSLTFKAPENLPHIFADRNAARMIFQNLISNAIKYTRENGTVECELSEGALSHNALFLRVSDNGIGIPASDQERIFEKLHRASNARLKVAEGTGLGLYVVKTVIERAGGTITFDSIEDKGTTFSVTIPLNWRAGPPVAPPTV